MGLQLHQSDLPTGLNLGRRIAVDTETMGLNQKRDALCLVQLSAGDGDAHLVQMNRKTYDCPNLKSCLSDPETEIIFHFARFDMAMLKHWLGIEVTPVFCTKIASKLSRTYTDRHGLRELARELLGIDLSKQQQSSDWGAEQLSNAQMEYAASDVLYLHKIADKLTQKLKRENRLALAHACFAALPMRIDLDLAGWQDMDIFAHI